VVAPRSPDIDAFATNLDAADSWLTPFYGFGASNFLAGDPAFRFADYREWIAARFPPRRFAQLEQKMDWPSLYAIGAFIQGLRQNPGLEATLQELGQQAHVYVGTGLGNIGKLYDASIELHHAQRRWDRFWSEPERNSALRKHLTAHGSDPVDGVPQAPAAAAACPASRPYCLGSRTDLSVCRCLFRSLVAGRPSPACLSTSRTPTRRGHVATSCTCPPGIPVRPSL